MHLARMIVERDLSVRAVERQVQAIRSRVGKTPVAANRPHIKRLEERLTQALGPRRRSGRG
jgi:hypothetical protein